MINIGSSFITVKTGNRSVTFHKNQVIGSEYHDNDQTLNITYRDTDNEVAEINVTDVTQEHFDLFIEGID